MSEKRSGKSWNLMIIVDRIDEGTAKLERRLVAGPPLLLEPPGDPEIPGPDRIEVDCSLVYNEIDP